MNMNLLANLSLRAFPTIKNLTQIYKRIVFKTYQIYDLRPLSGFFRAAQIFHSHVPATR